MKWQEKSGECSAAIGSVTQAQKAQAFGQVLADMGLTVFYQDERMTTVTAEQVLISGSVRREDRKRYVDKLAAAVILEQWLASQG